MQVKLFISKNREELRELPELCDQHNWQLTAQSLISFKPLDFSVQHPFDVIFIGSIRAFDYLVARYPEFRKSDFAVVGDTTARKMNVKNSQIKYLVENSGELTSNSLNFKEWLNIKRVLFPVSSISNQTYSKPISDEQKEVVEVYETISRPIPVEKQDIYVFTSPSNVRSFLELNEIPVESTLIAWGEATEKALVGSGVQVSHTLVKSSEKELVELINKLFV